MKKNRNNLVNAELITGAIRLAVVVMLFGFSLLVCAALSGCNMRSGVSIKDMTAEQIEAEKAKAQETIALGQAVAESGEYLPYPLNLIAVASGGALIILGGKKAAKLTGVVAKKIIVPALATTAGKILKKKSDAEACDEAADAETKIEAENGDQQK